MDGKRSREAAVEFLEYVAQKGLMSPATARARKAAVNTVLDILDDREAQDVTTIDLDDVMNRFGHLHGKDYSPVSLRTYRSRVKSALDDFANYLKNPLEFKPNVQSRERTTNPSRAATGAAKSTSKSENPASDPSRPRATSIAATIPSGIIPIPIRADLVVFIQGLPFDLTIAEARKIAGVVQAMATQQSA
ncbi:MAG TPA: site-specific integrase [Acidobacteriaceae bacterium]|nr:site-specific integrase [Acidobacteriaceae bacterium]